MSDMRIRFEWARVLAEFNQYLVAIGRPATTRGLRSYHLCALAEAMCRGPAGVTVDDLVGWLARDDWKPNTRRTAQTSLRVFFGWLQATGRRVDDPAAVLPRVRAHVGQPRPCPESTIRRAVLDAPVRTRLMIALGACSGLRRSEIATVRGDRVERGPEGFALRVLGKGDRERLVPITDALAEQILACGAGWTFPGQIDGHLSPAHVGKLVSRALPAGWTCHTLRHRFASAAYRADRDIRAVQELLGHASVATTQIYTAVPDGAKRRAAVAATLDDFQ